MPTLEKTIADSFSTPWNLFPILEKKTSRITVPPVLVLLGGCPGAAASNLPAVERWPGRQPLASAVRRPGLAGAGHTTHAPWPASVKDDFDQQKGIIGMVSC